MKKFILGFVTAVVLIIGGFFVLSNFFLDADGAVRVMGIAFFRLSPVRQSAAPASQSSNQQNNEARQPDEAVYCDVQKNSCSSYEKTQNSGNLEVTVTAAGKPAENLEVDVAYAPGAPQYYMRTTNGSGVALFSNLPAGDYKIYFNLENFPQGYDASQLAGVKITKGETAKTVIALKKK